MGTGSFPGVKRPVSGVDHPPPSSAAVRKEQSYTSTLPVGLTVCAEPQCLYKDALYLTNPEALHCTVSSSLVLPHRS